MKNRLLKAGNLFRSVIQSLFFRKKAPLAASWALTYRCNMKCRYCGLWRRGQNELSTAQIFELLTSLAKMRLAWITFTGGEPLLREDIGDILHCASSLGIFVKLNTNGVLIENKFSCLKNVDSVQLSLDGDNKTNDFIRGEGSFEAVKRGIDILSRLKKRVKILTVISKINIDDINFILEFSKKKNIQVTFQPVTKKILGGQEENPLSPSGYEYRRAIERIIEAKKQGFYITNSFAGLAHLRNYPQDAAMKCLAGMNIFDIGPNGDLISCNRYPFEQEASNILKTDCPESFNRLKHLNCKQCWCGPVVESNLISRLKVEPTINFFKNFIF